MAEIWSGGKLLRTQTITASSGTGTRGTWSATFDLPPGPAKLVFYEPSAENGQPLHQTTVDPLRPFPLTDAAQDRSGYNAAAGHADPR